MNSHQGNEKLFFLQVETVCTHPAPTCPPDSLITHAASLMREQDATVIFAHKQGHPLGCVSVDDLRNLVAESRPLEQLTVEEVMGEVVTVQRGDYVFEAIYRMARHNCTHLAVVDDEGQLFGVVSDSNLLRFQTKTPLYTSREIEAAQSIEALHDINLRMLEIVEHATRTGANIKALAQLISHLNDTFTQRVIALLNSQEGLSLPEGAAYLALGSEGRNEQTLRTDQDSAIIYRDDLPKNSLAELERFSERLVLALEAVGVPRCPGNTMVSNPAWRKSLSGWQERIDHWITVPKPEHMVDFGMFQDFRTLHGEPRLELHLRGHLHASVKRHKLFLPYMARHISHFPPPLGLFGRFRTERRGELRGTIDLKKAGIFAITEGVSLLALEAGFSGGSTWKKMGRLRDIGILTETSYKVLHAAFSELSRLRLHHQLLALRANKQPANNIDPTLLSRREQDRLREALRGVNHLLRMIRDRYRLDLISR